MMNSDEVTFSSYYYLGFLDGDFKVLWCDNSRLYKLLSTGGKKLIKRIKNSETETMFIHDMCFEGYRHKAFVHKIKEDLFLCRITKEIPETELEMEDLFEFVDNVKNSTLDIHSLLIMLDEYSRDFNYYKDEFHTKIKDARRKTVNILFDCYAILKSFEQNNCRYIPLLKYILRTWDIINFVTRKLNNKFDIDIDIAHSCVKIDYSKFELAFYNLIKVMLINLSDKSNSFVKVNDTIDNKIELIASFPKIKEISSEEYDAEVRSIKHIFRSMNGHFELCESENKYYAYGVFDVELSDDLDLIENGYDLEYVGSDEIFNRRIETGRYIRIYKPITDDKNYRFSSNVVELSDVDDSEVSFAEMFFEDLLQ